MNSLGMVGFRGSFCSSGDLVVDRRFLYARAASQDGDDAAAAEILGQALDLAPAWAPLWLALGEALEKLGRRGEAVAAYARAAALDPEGVLGAELNLARAGAGPAPSAAPETYVRALFDDYADRFDTHLTQALTYSGPALLREALARLGATRFSRVVDLGCGTGLCGAEFRGACAYLTGVDVSPRMVEVARAKAIYDRLDVGSIEDFLLREPTGSASLVLAADVLVYVGDLVPVLAAARRVLAHEGLLAFTLQHVESLAYCVGADLRFAHSEDYVRRAADAAGLVILLVEQATTRIEAGRPVPGLVVVATGSGRDGNS